MGIGFAVVIVQMHRTDAGSHLGKFVFNTARHVRVTGIEAVAEIQVSGAEKVIQARGGGQGVRCVLKQYLNAALRGKHLQFFERGECGVDAPLLELLAAGRQGAERCSETG